MTTWPLALAVSAALLGPLPALTSCSSCTEQADNSFGVRVRDANTGKPICDAQVIAQDGSYTWRTEPQKYPGFDCAYVGPSERSGTYTIHVARDGYVAQDGYLIALEGKCHVIPMSITVDLRSVAK